jgi:alkylation response protein AidB-like acyl-CoA dehydrogenase
MFSGQRFVSHLSRRRRRHCHHHDVVVDVCNNNRCITTVVASVTSVGSKSQQAATSTEVIIPIPKPSSPCLYSRAFSSSSSSSFSETPPLPITAFTEDELMTQEAVRSWSKEVLNPLKVRKMDNESKMCPKIIEDLFTQGFMGIEIPEEYDGGSGLSFTASCITIEELARVDPSVAIMVDIHNTCIINSIRFWGSTQLQNQFLSKLASTSVSSFCLSESESGSDAFSLKTTATKSNDESYYTINGNKMWISNAKEANTLLVFANVDPSLKYKGITAFVLDVNDYEHIILDSDNTTESAGGSSNANANSNTNAHNNGTITIGLPEKKLGLKASSTCPIHFDNVKVPASQILGEVGLGYKYCIEILNEGRIGIAAQQLGIAKGCLYDIALPYMLERKQFNKPIGEFQVTYSVLYCSSRPNIVYAYVLLMRRCILFLILFYLFCYYFLFYI